MNNIRLRRLLNIDSDYKLLEKWYLNRNVYLYFEQRSLSYEEIVKKYYPRTLEESKIIVYMIIYNDIEIGIIQYKEISKGVYDIDIFIGEEDYYHKGIGSKSICLISELLFNEKGANKLIMNPLKSNERAINCYLKCGFKIIKEYMEKDTIGNIQTYINMEKVR